MPQASKPAVSPFEGGQERRRSRKLLLFLCSAVVLLTVAAYWRTFGNGFVDYDDGDYITGNRHVQQGLSWEGIEWAFTSGHASNWHPLTWLSHMLDCEIFGMNPGGHHAVSLGIHIVNSLLILLLLRAATGSVWRSWAVAAMFALHPLHVESVAWVSERKDVLSGLFFLLTLITYQKYAASERGHSCPPKTPSLPRSGGEGRGEEAPKIHSPLPWLFLSLATYACGLMSKPMLVTTPFVLLLLDYWPLKRLNWNFKCLAKLVFEKLPFLALAAASSWVTFLVQREGGAVSVALSFGQRIANALVSYFRYVRKTFWPDDLSVLYPHPGDWPASFVVFSAILLLVITALVLFANRRTGASARYLFTGWFWFLGMLVPVIGIVQVGIQSMADRYTYLPSIGLFIGIVWGLARVVEFSLLNPNADRSADIPVRPAKAKVGKPFNPASLPGTDPEVALPSGIRADRNVRAPMWAVAPVLLAALLSLSAITFRQVGYWKNTETLFTRAVEVTKDNYLAYNNLGFYYSRQGQIAESMRFYEKSLAIKPDYEDALNNMGYALAKLGKHAEALPYYEHALRIRPKHTEVHNNLGNALSELGCLDEAIAHYQFVLQEKPDHADAHNNLAIAFAMKGRFGEAIEHFERTLSLNPTNTGTHSNLGNAYAIQQKFDKAIEHYRTALKLNPGDSQAHNNLANVLVQTGKLQDALTHYQTALKLNPENPEGHYNYGMALLRVSRKEEALQHFQEALKLRPGYEEAGRQVAGLLPASGEGPKKDLK